MGAYVVLQQGEDIDQALERFRHHCDRDQGRPWTKRRYGYYEKPSALRRKRKRRDRMTARHSGWHDEPASYNFRIGLAAQFCCTGPINTIGR